MPTSWQTITYKGEDFNLGDDVVVTVMPGPEVYQGFLNEIQPGDGGYIVLVGTGFQAVSGFGTVLGFPLSTLQSMKRPEAGV